jgi:hypothetical protein
LRITAEERPVDGMEDVVECGGWVQEQDSVVWVGGEEYSVAGFDGGSVSCGGGDVQVALAAHGEDAVRISVDRQDTVVLVDVQPGSRTPAEEAEEVLVGDPATRVDRRDAVHDRVATRYRDRRQREWTPGLGWPE